jgi:hypothetical protein
MARWKKKQEMKDLISGRKRDERADVQEKYVKRKLSMEGGKKRKV